MVLFIPVFALTVLGDGAVGPDGRQVYHMLPGMRTYPEMVTCFLLPSWLMLTGTLLQRPRGVISIPAMEGFLQVAAPTPKYTLGLGCNAAQVI